MAGIAHGLRCRETISELTLVVGAANGREDSSTPNHGRWRATRAPESPPRPRIAQIADWRGA
eukprot:3061970-Alexandrium_andersonii.AAC.1